MAVIRLPVSQQIRTIGEAQPSLGLRGRIRINPVLCDREIRGDHLLIAGRKSIKLSGVVTLLLHDLG